MKRQDIKSNEDWVKVSEDQIFEWVKTGSVTKREFVLWLDQVIELAIAQAYMFGEGDD